MKIHLRPCHREMTTRDITLLTQIPMPALNPVKK
jgi:hypothetical protein